MRWNGFEATRTGDVRKRINPKWCKTEENRSRLEAIRYGVEQDRKGEDTRRKEKEGMRAKEKRIGIERISTKMRGMGFEWGRKGEETIGTEMERTDAEMKRTGCELYSNGAI